MRANIMNVFIGIAILSAVAIIGCGRHDASDSEATHDHAAAAPAVEAEEAEGALDLKNGFDGMPSPGTDAFCPVMKQAFKVAANSPFSVYEGKTYVFCCPGCKEPFEKDPMKYLGG